MNRILGFVLALVVLGGAIYLLYPYLRTGQAPVTIEESSEVKVVTKTVKDDTAAYSIEVQYPEFGISAIDTDIKNKVNAAVEEFKTLAPSAPEIAQNEFGGTFQDVYIGADVISFAFVFSQYTGGAHPLAIISGLNYDRATGKQLLQSDAFTMIGMTVEEVSAAATEELKAKLGDAMFEEGANSNPENFSSFTISANTVTFIFQPYQVAAYAAGPQKVQFARVQQ